MQIYFVRSALNLFKYNNTLKLNIFNKNITIINKYKFCQKDSLIKENLKDTKNKKAKETETKTEKINWI